jgi:hypothetical protein
MAVHKIRETEETLSEIERQRALADQGIWQAEPKAIERFRRNFKLEFLDDSPTLIRLEVQEVIIEWGHKLLRKVVWARKGILEVKVDDSLNPLFNYNCCVNQEREWDDLRGWQYHRARTLCKEAFIAYWKEKAKGND